MKISYCKLEFHQFGTSKLDTFASEVRNGIYSNGFVFVTPPVTNTEFDDTQLAFSVAAAEYHQYGITKKTAFSVARTNLINKLDTLATYVDTIALGDVSIIALAGYTASRDQFQRVLPLEKIENFFIKNTNVSGQVTIDIPAIPNKGVVSYCCVCVEGAQLSNTNLVNGQIVMAAGDPQIRQDFNKSRRKTFTGLTSGIQHYFYVFATNSISVSPLSDYRIIYAM